MNEQPPSATNADDDWLDAALRADGREHRAEYLDDAGFTARVMAALPAPTALPAWRKPALTLLVGARGHRHRAGAARRGRRRRARRHARVVGGSARCRSAGIGAAVVALASRHLGGSRDRAARRLDAASAAQDARALPPGSRASAFRMRAADFPQEASLGAAITST